jgi:hypothetical protein
METTMRLSRDELFKITDFKTPRKQTQWFLDHLGVAVPHDRKGPILTPATCEALLAKRLGLTPKGEQPEREVVIHMREPRPTKKTSTKTPA